MYTADKAIINAAGRGTRMRPLTLTTPKPLIKVHGTPMIETAIDALHANGISEIYVVTGYLKEQFSYLPAKYPGLTLIENPYYADTNSISSMYCAREHISGAMVMDADQIIRNPAILDPHFEVSGYNAIYCAEGVSEWITYVDADDVILSTIPESTDPGWQTLGVSRWSFEDGAKLKAHLELEFEKNGNRNIYWDNIPLLIHPDEYRLKIWRQDDPDDLIELDSLRDLAKYDDTYMPLVNEISQI